MATETETTPAPEPAPPPEADTSEPASVDTAEATPAPQTTDWEKRYKAQQAELTRAQQALAQERGKPKVQEGEAPSEDWRSKWEQSEWARAEAVHGSEVIGAYDSFYRVFSTDATPMGTISALESYHQARLGGQKPAEAAAASPAPQPARSPSVDSNRSDASPDTDLDHQIEGAKAKGEAGLIELMRLRLQGRSQPPT